MTYFDKPYKSRLTIMFPSFTYNLLMSIIFTILKLTNVIDWDWVWVLNSLWLPYVIILVLWLFLWLIATLGIFLLLRKCGISVKTHIKKLKR